MPSSTAHGRIVLWTAALLLNLETGQGIAQSLPDPQDAQSLPSVTVFATRSEKLSKDIPNSIDQIEKSFIQKGRPTLTLDESLNTLPGLFFQNQFNAAQDLRVSIRGFGARSTFGIRGIKVLVDGIPYTLADGQTQVDSIDPGMLSGIEVIRGPSSSLYGNASGGILFLETEEGPETGVEVAPRFLAGSYDLQKYQMKAGGRSGNINYRIFSSHLTSDGYRRNSATESTNIHTKLRIRPHPDSEWVVTLGYFNSPLAKDPGALTQDEVRADPGQAAPNNVNFSAGEQVREDNLGISFNKALSARHDLSFMMHFNHRNFSNRLPFTNSGMVEFERLAPGMEIRSILDNRLWGLNHRLIAGLDIQSQRDDRQRFDNNQGVKGDLKLDQVESVISLGPYVRSEWTPDPQWNLVGGVRHDWVYYDLDDAFISDGDQSDSESLSEVSGTLGAVFHPDPAHDIYSNVSTVFEVPTTAELNVNPSGGPGFNSSLDAQKSVVYELGIRGRSINHFDYDLAMFFIHTRDEIIPFELPGSPGRNFFRNAGESERKGVELQGKYTFPGFLEATLSYTYSDFIFTEFDSNGTDLSGNVIPGIPEHRLAGSVKITGEQGWFSRMELQHVAGFFVNNENTVKNPAYTLTNLTVGRDIRSGPWEWSFFLILNNLLDETYNANTRINANNNRYFEPAPPFNVYGGISLTVRPF